MRLLHNVLEIRLQLNESTHGHIPENRSINPKQKTCSMQ